MACSASFSPIEHYVEETLFPGNSDLCAVTTSLGYILNHNGTLEIVIQNGHVLIRESGNNSNVLIYDNSTGILYDVYYSLNGAFCYSNQQTEWAFTLGEELLSYYNSIWSYLLGNTMDFSLLNISTVKLIKSCNAFLSLGTLFTETVTAESLTGLTAIFDGLGIESLSSIGGYVILPLVLFLSIDAVGFEDEEGYIDNYWNVHTPSQHPELTPIYDDVVQIKKHDYDDDRILHPNDRAEGMPPGITYAFVMANSGPSDDNGSFV